MTVNENFFVMTWFLVITGKFEKDYLESSSEKTRKLSFEYSNFCQKVNIQEFVNF